MAVNNELLTQLNTVILDCLKGHLQANYDKSAEFSVEVAKKVATSVEERLVAYTDSEIESLRQLLSSGDADLKPFLDFMAEVRSAMDGDENKEGFQIFNNLLADVSTTKATVEGHTTSITSMVQTLESYGSRIASLELRVKALEDAEPVATDCDACVDTMLGHVKDVFGAACTAASTAVNDHIAAKSVSALGDFDTFLANRTPVGVTVPDNGTPSGDGAVL